MLIAIDHGNYAIKTPHFLLFPAFPSIRSNRLWQMRCWNLAAATGRSLVKGSHT